MMTTSDLMGPRFAQPTYRRVHLADEPVVAPSASNARRFSRVLLALVGVTLLVLSGRAFVELVSQGWLSMPSAATLASSSNAGVNVEAGVIVRALLYPACAVASFVVSGLIGQHRA